MKAPRKLRRVLTIAAVLLAALVTALPAYADPIGGAGDGGGGTDGNGSFYAWVKSQVQFTGSGYDSKKRPTVGADYNPPHCWYQPEYTYDEMFEWAGRIRFTWIHQGPEDQRDGQAWYHDTLDQIKPYENEPGKTFWFLTSENTDAGWDCYAKTNPLWIHVGEQDSIVGEGRPITPADLARIARANLTLPTPDVDLFPPRTGGVYRSFVGLETIVSPLEPATPKTVTAYIEGVPNLTATVTARPDHMTITSTGPSDNHVLTECPEYKRGMNVEDTCYLRFARASTGGPYTVTVTQWWTIDSEPAAPMGENPFPMPSEPKTIVVDEIQSVANG